MALEKQRVERVEPESPERVRSSSPARVLVLRKLAVGSADDSLEAEADRAADEVMRILRSVSADGSAPGGLWHGRPTRIRRHASADHHEHPAGQVASGPEVGMAGGAISGELSTRIARASGGAPLGERTLSRMEQGFGVSFADVRVHAESDLPRQIAADAFTAGSHLHFAPGRYDPSSSAGERLLAHELAHVIQQGGALSRQALEPGRGSRITRHACHNGCEHGVLIRRAIAQNTWTNDIAPNLRGLVMIKVTNDATAATLAVKGTVNAHGPVVYESMAGAGQPWQVIANVPAFLAGHSWDEKFINNRQVKDVVDFATPAGLQSNIPAQGKVFMDVRSVAGDPHSIVHHSFKTYKVTPKGKSAKPTAYSGDHHLTVENAHLLLMDEIKNTRSSAGIDKTTLMKPAVEAELHKRGYNAIDNINFYPRRDAQETRGLPTAVSMDRLDEAAHPDKVDVDPRLSLLQYLTFIQRALASIPNVPPVYGAKILRTARVMNDLANWDPATMFLRVGAGDQRHLIRAVLAMDAKGLVVGLNLPQATKDVFKRYCTSTPDLPLSEPVADETEWVQKGSLSQDTKTHYNELETRYVKAHADAVVNAILAFIA